MQATATLPEPVVLKRTVNVCGPGDGAARGGNWTMKLLVAGVGELVTGEASFGLTVLMRE
jgi:hypothetical protein